MEEKRMPAILMYPSDWDSDVALNRCSVGAQWLWLKAIWIMHTCQPYGHLIQNGQPITEKELSKLVRLDPKRGTKKVHKWVQEWDTFGVSSRTKEGVIFSRRMVRDEANRLINRVNGAKGGNPAFKNPVNPPVNGGDKAKPLSLSRNIFTPLSGTSVPEQAPFSEFVETYNQLRGVLPKATGLSASRKKKILSRWKEKPDLDYWRMVFEKAGRSQKMASWASFPWLIENSENHTKTAEGNYDNGRENRLAPRPAAVKVSAPPQPPAELTDDELREIHRDFVRDLGRCRTQNCKFCQEVLVSVSSGNGSQ